jgi:hypothetical protein
LMSNYLVIKFMITNSILKMRSDEGCKLPLHCQSTYGRFCA